MVIDFHTHAFPDKLALRALSSLAEKAGGLTYYTDGTIADTDEKMKQWGVDKRVMLSIATNAKQQHNVNSFAIENNNDHIIAFGSVHPDAPDALDEIDRIKNAGLLGIKFHPEYQQFLIDDPKMFPLYDKCRALGLVMSFHAGRDLGFPDTLMAPPQRSRRVIDNFPGAKIVLAHMAAPCSMKTCWNISPERTAILTRRFRSTVCLNKWQRPLSKSTARTGFCLEATARGSARAIHSIMLTRFRFRRSTRTGFTARMRCVCLGSTADCWLLKMF